MRSAEVVLRRGAVKNHLRRGVPDPRRIVNRGRVIGGRRVVGRRRRIHNRAYVRILKVISF